MLIYRLKILSTMKQNQIDEINEIEKNENDLLKKAEYLKNACKSIYETQNKFESR